MFKSIVFIAITFSMFGCSNFQAYDGYKQPENEVVLIKGMSNLDISAGGYAAKICGIDNVMFESCQPFVEFLPGEKTLYLESTYMGIFASKSIITKKFEPGDRYILAIEFTGPASEVPVIIFRGNINQPNQQLKRTP